MHLALACQTLQETASFDIRATYNIVISISHPLFITASAGNSGAALAYAAARRGKRSIVVMPSTSPKNKIDAVREHHGQIELVNVRLKTPAERVRELPQNIPRPML